MVKQLDWHTCAKLAVQMEKEKEQILSNIVESLGADPCILGIVVVVFSFLYFMRYTYKHQEKMERLRLSHYIEIQNGDGKDGTG